jgi:hypothetical protein
MFDHIKKILKYSVVIASGLFIASCGGDDSKDKGPHSELLGSDFLRGASIVDSAEFVSAFNDDRFNYGSTVFTSVDAVHYRYSGCRISGWFSQNAEIYNNGFIYTKFTVKGVDYESICNVDEVYRDVQVSDAASLDIAYMGEKLFYDKTTKYIYQTNVRTSSPISIIEVFNNGMSAKIEFSSGDTEDVALVKVYEEIDPSEKGIVLYKPSQEYYKGKSGVIMETGATKAARNKPYNMSSGYLFKYKEVGCGFKLFTPTPYTIDTDGSVYAKSVSTGKEYHCYIDKFYEKTNATTNEAVNALLVISDLDSSTFYDDSTKTFYEIDVSNSNGDYFIKEIINDGRSALMDNGEGSSYVAVILTSYKQVFPG